MAKKQDDNILGTEELTEVVKSGTATDGLVFDLSNVSEEQEFEVLPKGDYPAIVEVMEFGDSSNDNPMISVTFSVTDPEFENRKIFDYWVLGGKGEAFGKAKLKKFLTRICPEVNISAFNPVAFCESGDALNKEVMLKVKVQTQKKGEYAGTKRNQVSDITAVADSGFGF